MTAILRVSGHDIDMDACLQWLPPERIEASWRRGERRFGRAPEVSSGFNMLVADEETHVDAIATALTVLTGLSARLRQLLEQGASGSIDFSLEVQGPTPTSLTFSSEFLTLVSMLGLQLVVSAYPCSDDDD